MRRFIIVSLIVFSYAWSKSVVCAVPKYLFKQSNALFGDTIAYTKLRVKLKPYKDNQACLSAVARKEVSFAIIRSDILWALHHRYLEWGELDSKYITISTLPYKAYLYLIRPKEAFDIDIAEIQTKNISIDTLGQANAYLLKNILKQIGMQYQVHYESLSYKTSLEEIENNSLYAYWGLLPSDHENSRFHFQTLFSKDISTYLESLKPFKSDYNGLYVYYALIASTTASDEEIENIIFRLEEKKYFTPQTDTNYGPTNQYVLEHLDQIRSTLRIKENRRNVSSVKKQRKCLDYHYGFLKLLRKKPGLKKIVKQIKHRRPDHYKQARKMIKQIDHILYAIDAKKEICDFTFLEKKSREFNYTKKILTHLLEEK